MSTVLVAGLCLSWIQAGPDIHPCWHITTSETRVVNSRQPCPMREKKRKKHERHTKSDLSRPRREWLAPVKGKPSVPL